MTWTYTDDYYREYTRVTWNESAEQYVKFMRVLEPFGHELLKGVRPKPGEKVLDIATGPGEPGMTIAKAVGPKGDVTGIDLSENMIGIANRVAKARGLANAKFEVMDAEKLTFPDATFDVALSRFGFQIFTNPEGVAKETRRVLKKGGRFGATVWSTGDKVPAIHVVVGPMLEFAEPDETGYIPTPYELGGPGEFVKFLKDAGFQDAKERRVTYDWEWKDRDEFWAMILKATPIGHSLHEEDEPTQKKIVEMTNRNLERYRTKSGGYKLPAECVVVTARR